MTRFNPNDLGKVILWWSKGTALLSAIELLDRSDQYFLRAGDFHVECLKHEIKLRDDERLVGIASFTAILSFHYEFQFIIARKPA